jgi:Tfp pilus assembly protein PilV
MKEKQFNTITVKNHKGIAMIELIFAIVVIGISLLSIPNLLYTAAASGYTSMQQEAIAAASSDMSLILTNRWDEANTDPKLPAVILTTDSTTVGLTQSTRASLKSRTYFSAAGGTMSASASSTFQNPDTGDIGQDDIDDIPAVTAGHIEDGTQDLIDTISVSTTVSYLNDSTTTGSWNTATNTYDEPFIAAAPVGTSNVKGIIMTLTSGSGTPELEKTIKLKAFSCNIGSYELERKEF